MKKNKKALREALEEKKNIEAEINRLEKKEDIQKKILANEFGGKNRNISQDKIRKFSSDKADEIKPVVIDGRDKFKKPPMKAFSKHELPVNDQQIPKVPLQRDSISVKLS